MAHTHRNLKTFWLILIFNLTAGICAIGQVKDIKDAPAIKDLTWIEAKKLLTDSSIVMIPLGAAAKEHGPHLPLKNDWIMAEYLRNRIAKESDVIIYPTINYHYYPAFLQYAGSTSLRLETATNLLVDLCQVISAHGPKKFYILNTGVSTIVPLRIAAKKLESQGILMTFTDILNVAKEAEEKVKKEKAGTHADEIETSMMLYMAPQTVNMKKAAKDIPERDGPGPLTPYQNGEGIYSPTGIYGDATLATRPKGEIVVEAMVRGIRQEIQKLRETPVPPSAQLLELARFEGTFHAGTDRFVIIQNGDHFTFQRNDDKSIRMKPESATSFYIGQTGRIVFFTDESGTYSTAFINLLGRDYLAKKK